MITKFKTDYRSPRRNYDSDFSREDEIMINLHQLKTLADLISRNFEDEEREVRLLELENLTSLEAEDQIFQYLSATWN